MRILCQSGDSVVGPLGDTGAGVIDGVLSRYIALFFSSSKSSFKRRSWSLNSFFSSIRRRIRISDKNGNI